MLSPERCFKRLSRSRNDIFAFFNQKNVKVYRQDRPASGEGETRRALFGGRAKNVGYQVVISKNAPPCLWQRGRSDRLQRWDTTKGRGQQEARSTQQEARRDPGPGTTIPPTCTSEMTWTGRLGQQGSVSKAQAGRCRLMPSAPPISRMSAGRAANRPLVTTPTIALMRVSRATGSSMSRP